MKNLMTAPDTNIQIARRKQLENRQWFDAHVDELIKQYPGKSIAVQDGKIISEGNNENEVLKTAMEKAKQEGWEEEELLFIMVPAKEVVQVQYPGG